MEQNYDLENKVMVKAFNKVIQLGKELTTKHQYDNTYEEALRIARIHTILKVHDLIESIQELEGIASAGVLESLCKDDMEDQVESRIATDHRIVDINNNIAKLMTELVTDVLGEDELQSISLQVQLDNIM